MGDIVQGILSWGLLSGGDIVLIPGEISRGKGIGRKYPEGKGIERKMSGGKRQGGNVWGEIS